tara:strand:+ start:858 stop:1064 length:207 start_codon:yes stop_codon:yes gene_type:complete
MDNEKTFPELKELYLQSMNKSEKVAYEIAVKNLETSYDMIKTIGFLKFVKDNQYTIINKKEERIISNF